MNLDRHRFADPATTGPLTDAELERLRVAVARARTLDPPIAYGEATVATNDDTQRPAGDEALIRLVVGTAKATAIALSWAITGYLAAVNTGLLGWVD